MRYGFHISFSGVVNEVKPEPGDTPMDAPETIQDIEELIRHSFPHDLQAGVHIDGIQINVFEKPEYLAASISQEPPAA